LVNCLYRVVDNDRVASFLLVRILNTSVLNPITGDCREAWRAFSVTAELHSLEIFSGSNQSVNQFNLGNVAHMREENRYITHTTITAERREKLKEIKQ